MSSAKSLCLLFLLHLIFCNAYAKSPCPFNEEACTCTSTNASTPNVFDDVECRWPTLPVLHAVSGSKYSAKTLSIESQLDRLPSFYLAAFDTIDKLFLLQNLSAGSVKPNWDDQAFDSVQINGIYTSGIDALFPLPMALCRVGNRGLSILDFSNGYVPLKIASSSFSDFKSLKTFTIEGIPISDLDDEAFVGLENVLIDVELSGAELKEFPVAALSKLTELTSLNLDANAISKIPDGAFSALGRLQRLFLMINPLANDIEAGSLDSLPPALSALYLDNVGLKTIPRSILEKNKFLGGLSLTYNPITTISKSDLANLNSISLVSLSFYGNPISRVDVGAFENVTATGAFYINMGSTVLTTFDLAAFAGSVPANLTAAMNSNQNLINLTISSLEKVIVFLECVGEGTFEFPLKICL